MKCPHCGAESADELTFDYTTKTVSYGGKSCQMQPQQILILEHLLDAGSHGISKLALWSALYGNMPDGQERNMKVLDTHFSYMRRALREAGIEVTIKSNSAHRDAGHRIYLVKELPSAKGHYGSHFVKQGDKFHAAV